MIEEKDIKEGNKIISIVNGSVFEISRIYKNDNGQDYVMLTDIHNIHRYEISKKHLMHMQFDLYYKQKRKITVNG